MASYTVKKGDTLSEIAKKYNSTYHYGSTNKQAYMKLAQMNDIDDPDFIVVGQVLELDPSKAGSKAVSKTSKAEIKAFGLQSNTNYVLYASWAWDKGHTENYRVYWTYDTGDGIWFIGNDSTTEAKQSTYTIPENAKAVRFKVLPQSESKSSESESKYWTASWSTVKTFNMEDAPPQKPSVPTVEIDKYKLTATLANIDASAKSIQFQVVKDDSTIFSTGTGTVTTSAASYSCNVTAGGKYKVRARAIKGNLYSDWSEYSGNVETIPAASSGITTIKALSDTSVSIEWNKASNADSYEVEYTTDKSWFDTSTSNVKSVTVDSTVTQAIITGMESGDEYFFRVRATNSKGSSAWTEIKSIVIGKTPSAPTTWSSTTTVIVGEPLNFYWIHNSEDGSNQSYAELELNINGVIDTKTIKGTTPEDEEEKTSSYSFDTSLYVEGTKILWRVRTAGITNTYGEWSVQRTVDVYAPPTVELTLTDQNGELVDSLSSFPFHIRALAGPNTQAPIGYHLVISSNEIYETVDQVGNKKTVNVGEEVYSRYFDITEVLNVDLSAGDLDLENNISYTVACTVSMNSGLKAESSVIFTVAWSGEMYEPNAEIAIDKENYTASILPYCMDEKNNLIENVTLSVYRREFDGSFVEILTGIPNDEKTFVTDPHPALDYARYRIVAVSTLTGMVSYYDMPGVPVGGKAVIIQWDDKWTNFNSEDGNDPEELEQPVYSGSMLKLPYNVNISDKNSRDVSLIEYIGRKRPVTYYGTQLGESASVSLEIDKSDKETLYALRRLAIWMGDVYFREPSGSGYWANINVSFSQTHKEVVIPVTLDITRVEGGI